MQMTTEHREKLRARLGVFEEELKRTMKSGSHWGGAGTLDLAEEIFKITSKLGSERTARREYASVLYAVAGAAYAHGRECRLHGLKGIIPMIRWFFRAYRSLKKSVRLCKQIQADVGYKSMTPDELLVYAGAMRKWGKLELAWEAVSQGLERAGMSLEKDILFRAYAGEINDARINTEIGGKFFEEVFPLPSPEKLDPAVQARFYRMYAEHLQIAGQANSSVQFLKIALEVARQHKLADEIRKILMDLPDHGTLFPSAPMIL